MTTRPAHSDFKRMAEIIRRLDRYAEEGLESNAIETALAELVLDRESVDYMSAQRVLRAIAVLSEESPSSFEVTTVLGATWLDGFMLGYIFGTGDTGFLPEDPGY